MKDSAHWLQVLHPDAAALSSYWQPMEPESGPNARIQPVLYVLQWCALVSWIYQLALFFSEKIVVISIKKQARKASLFPS